MTYVELLAEISKRKFHRVYFIVGRESFLVESAVDRLLDAVCDPATREFNLDVFYGDEAEGYRIVEAANSYPMMSEFRVVVVKEVHQLPSRDLDLLAKFTERPAPSTRLILCSSRDDARSKALDRIKRKACVVTCKPLYDREVPGWMRAYVKERGYEITQGAILLVQARVGNDLRDIANELDKVMVNLDHKKSITEADVQEVVGISKSYTVFELTDAIGNKDLNKALLILDSMLQYGESPTGILVMIRRHFENLLKVKGAVAQKKSQDEVAALTGIPKYFIKKTMAMASKYSFEDIQEAFNLLLETDLALKTSKQKPRIALETLMIQVIRGVSFLRK